VGRYLAAACDTVFHFASSSRASTRFLAIPTLARHSFGRVLDFSPISRCTGGFLQPPPFPNAEACA
jgi:hypothetical protein